MAKKEANLSYFPLDTTWMRDADIKKMMYEFRKKSANKDNMTALAACGLYWLIIADMHVTDFKAGAADIEAQADDFRVPEEFLKKVLDDFGLFEKDGDKYISQRVLRNKENVTDSSANGKAGADKRWGKLQEEKAEIAQFAEDNEEFISEIVETFNEMFGTTRTVSDTTVLKIAEKIIKNDKLKELEGWKKTFKNAKKGWTIDGVVKKPGFTRILSEWDSFYSDDCNLNEYDPEEAEKQRKEKALEAEKRREKEALDAEKQKVKNAEANEKRTKQLQEEFNAICDKKSAFDYLSKIRGCPQMYVHIPAVMKEKLEEHGVNYDNYTKERDAYLELTEGKND